MAEITDPLLREIEEEMREEKFTKLWKKYGIFLIGGVVALVVGVAGFQWWTGYATDKRMETGRQFDSATELVIAGNVEDARAAFDALAANSDDGYALIASLRSAQLQIDAGNVPAARTAFRTATSSCSWVNEGARSMPICVSVIGSWYIEIPMFYV